MEYTPFFENMVCVCGGERLFLTEMMDIMKRFLFFLTLVIACVTLTGSKPLDGTLVRTGTADPCLLYQDGYFYLTMTGSTRLAMIKDKSLSCLTSEYHPLGENIIYDAKNDPTVREVFGPDALVNGTWSPEILNRHSNWKLLLTIGWRF